jgi:hypothetical protein
MPFQRSSTCPPTFDVLRRNPAEIRRFLLTHILTFYGRVARHPVGRANHVIPSKSSSWPSCLRGEATVPQTQYPNSIASSELKIHRSSRKSRQSNMAKPVRIALKNRHSRVTQFAKRWSPVDQTCPNNQPLADSHQPTAAGFLSAFGPNLNRGTMIGPTNTTRHQGGLWR